MPIQIKLCGINSETALHSAISAAPDYVGFVHFKRSPRHLELTEMARLRAMLPTRIKAVVVLVNPDDTLLETLATQVKPDFLQLHGGESPERVHEITKKFSIPAIKAIAVSGEDDIAKVSAFNGAAAMILFDAKPASSELPGGTGISFNWELLRNRNISLPWLLSGGLTAENVAHAIAISGAGAVDVSSGIEDAPGVKSAEKIAAFVAMVRTLDDK